jgi:DNA repair and recombination protein RAD52
MADFGVTEDGHPDEVMLPPSHGSGEQASRASDRSQSMNSGNLNDRNKPPTNGLPPRPMQPPSRPAAQPSRPPHTPNQQPQHQQHQRPGATFQGRPNPQQQQLSRPPSHMNTAAQQGVTSNKVMTPPPNAAPRPPHPANVPNRAANEPATFFSARSMKDMPENVDPATAVAKQVFDPHAESPSIRKTPGIDHKSSKPLSKSGVHVQPVKRDLDQPQHRPSPGGPPNVVNPALSQMRQIGAPGGPGSPLANRGQYRPPTILKRSAPGGGPEGGNGNRAPLSEVSTNGPPTAAGAVGVDAKRQKMS